MGRERKERERREKQAKKIHHPLLSFSFFPLSAPRDERHTRRQIFDSSNVSITGGGVIRGQGASITLLCHLAVGPHCVHGSPDRAHAAPIPPTPPHSTHATPDPSAGYSWWVATLSGKKADQSRPDLINIEQSTNVQLRDLTMLNSPQFHVRMHDVIHVDVRNITIWVDIERQRDLLIRAGHWLELEGVGADGLGKGLPMFPLNTGAPPPPLSSRACGQHPACLPAWPCRLGLSRLHTIPHTCLRAPVLQMASTLLGRTFTSATAPSRILTTLSQVGAPGPRLPPVAALRCRLPCVKGPAPTLHRRPPRPLAKPSHRGRVYANCTTDMLVEVGGGRGPPGIRPAAGWPALQRVAPTVFRSAHVGHYSVLRRWHVHWQRPAQRRRKRRLALERGLPQPAAARLRPPAPAGSAPLPLPCRSTTASAT